MKYTVVGFARDQAHWLEAEIAKERYDSVNRAKNFCLLAMGFEERFQLVLDNFHEWEMTLLNQAHHFLLWKATDHNAAMQDRLSLDRHLVNLLSSMRLYLDHTDHGLSTMFGNPSDQLESIKKFKGTLYDKHLGYRLLEALRNHVQHCGLPVHSISYNQSRVETLKKHVFVQSLVQPRLDFNELASNHGFKASVLKEIQQLGEKIDLRPFAREYISCLIELHYQIRNKVSDVITQNRQIYAAAIKEYSTIDAKVIKHSWLQCSDDLGAITEKVELFLELLDRYDALYQRNSKVNSIVNSFVSSAAHEK
jgi:hypothetical protein